MIMLSLTFDHLFLSFDIDNEKDFGSRNFAFVRLECFGVAVLLDTRNGWVNTC